MSLIVDVTPLREFFADIVDPKEMGDRLQDIEEKYVSYLLKDPTAKGEETENEIYYLRELKKAIRALPVGLTRP